MTDFIREVEEEYRRDKAIEAWKRYQNWIIALAILIISPRRLAFYQSQQKAAAEAAGARFESAVQLAAKARRRRPNRRFSKFARTGRAATPSCPAFARRRRLRQRNRAEAVTIYDALANDRAFRP